MIARLVMAGTVLLTALLLQTVVLPAVAVAGWRPDLVGLTVVAFALADGPDTGARYGFTAGLVTDLVAGGAALVGLSALVLLLVGDAAGRLRPYLSGTAVLGEMALAGVAGAVSVGLYGVLTLLLDLGQLGVPALLQATATAAVTNALLAPLVCRPVAALSRRFPVAQVSAGTRGPGGNAW